MIYWRFDSWEIQCSFYLKKNTIIIIIIGDMWFVVCISFPIALWAIVRVCATVLWCAYICVCVSYHATMCCLCKCMSSCVCVCVVCGENVEVTDSRIAIIQYMIRCCVCVFAILFFFLFLSLYTVNHHLAQADWRNEFEKKKKKKENYSNKLE